MNIVLNLNFVSRQKVITGAGTPPGEAGEGCAVLVRSTVGS